MIKIPRLALIPVSNNLPSHISKVFSGDTYSSRTVTCTSEIIELMQDEEDFFDGVLVIANGESLEAITEILVRLQGESALVDTPLIVYLNSESPDIAGLYDAGAQLVILPQLPAQWIHHQLGVLGGASRQERAQHVRKKLEIDFLHQALHTMNLSQDGLLVFDFQQKLIFQNHSAKVLLGSDGSPGQASVITRMFSKFINEHEHSRKLQYEQSDGKLVSQFDTSIRSVDAREQRVKLEVLSLTNKGNVEAHGFAVRIIELAQFSQVAQRLDQELRTRSLCLLNTALAIKLLESRVNNGSPGLLGIGNEFMANLPKSAALTNSIAQVLEFLDLAISPNVPVKVSVQEDYSIALPAVDLIQILGHMMLHGLQVAGASGEIKIESSANIPGEGVTVQVSATSLIIRALSPSEVLDEILHDQLADYLGGQAPATKLPAGISAAQKLAEKHRTTIEYRQEESGEVKLRIRLPIMRDLNNNPPKH